jgi:putative ABC transport system permease protein
MSEMSARRNISYRPFTQSPVNQMAILVRTSGDAGALAQSIRAQAQALDPDLPLTLMQTMEDVVAKSLAARRFGMRLLSIFGSVALILTALGLYGVVAAGVSDRTREIAIRLALGASLSRIAGAVVRQMFFITLTGVTAGVVVAVGATRYLEPPLFGIARTDFTTYGTTAAILAIVTLVGSYLPARRVTQIDPALTLRSE